MYFMFVRSKSIGVNVCGEIGTYGDRRTIDPNVMSKFWESVSVSNFRRLSSY